MVAATIPCGIGIPEEQNPRSVVTLVAILDVRTKSELVGSDIESTQFIGNTSLEIRDVQEANVRIIPDDHSMRRLAQQHHGVGIRVWVVLQ